MTDQKDAINYRGLHIPFTRLGQGAVTSDNLFDPNEQVIFDFYEANVDRYRKAVDIGANIGVHSILMANQGWAVLAYEPDPYHVSIMKQNFREHHLVGPQVQVYNEAVSDHVGKTTFVRLLDNTTGSHLLGAKKSYGPKERFQVAVAPAAPLFQWADFVKMDCEGHEAVIIRSIPAECWADTDCLMEVGSADNARVIYDHLVDVVPMWSQKIGWSRVAELADVPHHHSEGSLFVGMNPPFPPRETGD